MGHWQLRLLLWQWFVRCGLGPVIFSITHTQVFTQHTKKNTMSSLLASDIFGIGAPVVLMGAGAALATWFLEDAVKDQIGSKPWLLPVVAGVAGMGAGFLVGPSLGLRT
jgi:hypothetical protein